MLNRFSPVAFPGAAGASSTGSLPSPTGTNGVDGQNIVFGQPSSGTNGMLPVGIILQTSGTASTVDPTNGATNNTKFRRSAWASSASAGQNAGIYTSHGRFFRGSTGGFVFTALVGLTTANTTGYQTFVGLCASTSALSGDPSALVNMIGVGFDAGDASSGTWFLMNNDGSGTATRTAITGMARDTTSLYSVQISMPLGDTASPTVTVLNAVTGASIYSGTVSTDLPAAGTLMALKLEARNGAVTAACGISCARFSVVSNWS